MTIADIDDCTRIIYLLNEEKKDFYKKMEFYMRGFDNILTVPSKDVLKEPGLSAKQIAIISGIKQDTFIEGQIAILEKIEKCETPIEKLPEEISQEFEWQKPKFKELHHFSRSDTHIHWSRYVLPHSTRSFFRSVCRCLYRLCNRFH